MDFAKKDEGHREGRILEAELASQLRDIASFEESLVVRLSSFVALFAESSDLSEDEKERFNRIISRLSEDSMKHLNAVRQILEGKFGGSHK